MTFGDLPLLTTDIPYGKTSFAVRGLSTEDVAHILPRYGSDVVMLLGGVLAGQQVDTSTLPTMLKTVVTETPGLVAEVIARAADDPSPKGVGRARKLPLPVQIAALTAIYYNTFTSESELKNFVGIIVKLVTTTSGLVESVIPEVLSEAGIGASDAA